MMVSLTVI